MWNKFKIAIIILPVLAVVLLVGNTIYEQRKIDQQLSNANNLVWGSGDDEITFQVQKSSSGELDTYEISQHRNNQPRHEKDNFVVNKDMYGGGFINAVQADNDQELEVLVWGIAEEDKSYLLDYSEGKLVKKSFKQLPDEIKDLARQWHEVNITNPMAILFFALFALSLYSFIGIIWLIRKIIKHFRA